MNDYKKYKTLFNERGNRCSIGAFNVFNLQTAEAVVRASNELEMPVIIQMSMSVVKKLGVAKATAILETAIAEAEQTIYYHLDHCTEPEIAKACIKAGWKSIMFDGSALNHDENIRLTKEIVDYAKDFDVLVEGEVGAIQGVEDHISVDTAKLATVEEVIDFVEQTGVDSIAPSIGTAHGVYKGTPEINYDLVSELSEDNKYHVVIHGGTGLNFEDYQRLVKCGAAKINVSTAIKHGYLDTMKAIVEGELVYNPTAYDEKIIEGVKKVVKEFIMAFKVKESSKVGS